MKYFGWYGWSVPDYDRCWNVVQSKGVRICAANVGTVVSDEATSQEPDNKGRLANTISSNHGDIDNLLLLPGEVSEDGGERWLLTVWRCLGRGHLIETRAEMVRLVCLYSPLLIQRVRGWLMFWNTQKKLRRESHREQFRARTNILLYFPNWYTKNCYFI